MEGDGLPVNMLKQPTSQVEREGASTERGLWYSTEKHHHTISVDSFIGFKEQAFVACTLAVLKEVMI